MRIRLVGDNLDIQQRHKDMVRNTIQTKLEKYLKPFNADMKFADMKIEKRSRWGYKVNLSMVLLGKKQIFAQVVDRNLHKALTSLREKIRRQIQEYRDKIDVDHQRVQPMNQLI